MASMLQRASRAAASRALALGRADGHHAVTAWRVGGPPAIFRGIHHGEDGWRGGTGPVSDWGAGRGRAGAFGIDRPFALGGAQTRAVHASTPSHEKRDGSVSTTVLDDLLKVRTLSRDGEPSRNPKTRTEPPRRTHASKSIHHHTSIVVVA